MGAHRLMQKVNQKQYGKKYSTTEQLTGDVWIDGKPIYRKVINIGTLPNATTKSVAHGISNLETVIDIKGFYKEGTVYIPNVYVVPGTLSNGVRTYISGGNVNVSAGINRTGYSGYVIIEYTKT